MTKNAKDTREKRAYLVLGAERTGTRLMARILMAAGCYGDDGHEQRLDYEIWEDVSPIVWRRSVPHRTEWPDILSMIEELQKRGFEVQAVVMMRDWFATGQSQVHEGLARDMETAYLNQQLAYRCIFGDLHQADIPFVVITYESLVQRPGPVCDHLTELLGLPPIVSVDVYDGNQRYYAE